MCCWCALLGFPSKANSWGSGFFPSTLHMWNNARNRSRVFSSVPNYRCHLQSLEERFNFAKSRSSAVLGFPHPGV